MIDQNEILVEVIDIGGGELKIRCNYGISFTYLQFYDDRFIEVLDFKKGDSFYNLDSAKEYAGNYKKYLIKSEHKIIKTF